jgi:hypothetical protein
MPFNSSSMILYEGKNDREKERKGKRKIQF